MSRRLARASTVGAITLSALGSLSASPARAEILHPRQQWLRDSAGGLFLHWGMRTAPGFKDCTAWEKAISDGGWSPEYWVGETLKLHAQYLVFAPFHSRLGYGRAWPSAIPGTCSTKRDFLGELIAAAKAKGLRVVLYMTDDPQWYWEGLRERPQDPNDADDLGKPSWMDSAAYSAYKHRPVNLQRGPGFGEFSYDNFVEVMSKYPDLAGFWIDNDNAYWERNGLYERVRAERPTWTLSNNNEDTPIMDMVSHEQKVGMTPAYDYPQAVWTPMPRLTEGCWKLPVRGAWWFDGTDSEVDYAATLGRIISNAGSSIKSLMAETAMINGTLPAKQAEFNDFAAGYLRPIRESIHGVEGGGYMYGGLVPGFWNDGAHGVTTVSRANPDLHYVHVLTKPARAGSLALRDNGYRVKSVSDLRTGQAMRFSQSDGSLTIEGVTAWDKYDTVFKVETTGRIGLYPTSSIRAVATAEADGFPARHLVDGDYLTYWQNDAKLPVSITLDQGSERPLAYLALNQREWSPTYRRARGAEDSARIKDYRVYLSSDGRGWGDPVLSATMPSARAVQLVALKPVRSARYLRLEVLSIWASAHARRQYQKLAIDELWLGSGYPSGATPAH